MPFRYHDTPYRRLFSIAVKFLIDFVNFELDGFPPVAVSKITKKLKINCCRKVFIVCNTKFIDI